MEKTEPRLCRYCGTPLKADATYCLECKRFQNPLRNGFSSFSPTFILSLLALAGVIYGFLQREVLAPRPVIAATPLACAPDKLIVAVENHGTRSAILVGGTLSLAASAEGGQQDRKLWDAQLPIVLDPNASKLVGVEIYSNGPGYVPSPMPSRSGQCQYALNLKVVDFQGQDRGPSGMTCPCS